MKKTRYLAAALCVAVLMCGLTLPAYAYADEDEDKTPPVVEEPVVEEPAAEEPTGGVDWEGLEPTYPLTPDGAGTVVDNATDEDGKEFFTIVTADESVFYLVIDRQRNGQNVYFLNAVTLADLTSLAESNGETLVTAPTAPVTPPEPDPGTTPEPDPGTEPEPDPAQEPEPAAKGGVNVGTLVLALAVVAIGGGAGWYFKIYRPKQQRAADLAEENFSGEDDGEALPPWDEDDPEDLE